MLLKTLNILVLIIMYILVLKNTITLPTPKNPVNGYNVKKTLDIQLAKCHFDQIIIKTASQKNSSLGMIDTNNEINCDYDSFYITKTSIKYCFMLERQGSNRNINFQNCPVSFFDRQFWGPGLLALELFCSFRYKCHLVTPIFFKCFIYLSVRYSWQRVYITMWDFII